MINLQKKSMINRPIFTIRIALFALFMAANIGAGCSVLAQTIQATSAAGAYQIRGGTKTAGRTDYALLIANETFTDSHYKKLVNPIFDARAIETLLREKFGFQTILLTASTKDSCIQQLRAIAGRKFGPNDQLFVYLAGHGDFDPLLQQGYAVMKDSKSTDNSFTNHLSFAYLQDLLSKLRCRHVLLTLDVCYGGTFDSYFATQSSSEFRGDGPTRGVGVSVEEAGGQTPYILDKLKPQTRKYLSSGGKQTVPDGQAGQHSPFARFFIQKLTEAAASDYRILPATELKVFVERQIAINHVEANVKMGSFGSDESSSDFLFIAK